MKKAYDVMTRSIAGVPPQTSVAQVASMMRDLNIGDVLVLDEGKLRGIVTDRDLTIHVLTNGAKSDAPVEHYMTTDVVTGAPDWTLERVAEVMGKHQIRRLPIVENDQVLGIVSLGDVALHMPKHETVGTSLKNISEVTRTNFNLASPLTKFVTLAVPIALGAGVLLFANTKSGQRVRKQIQSSDLAAQAGAIVTAAVVALRDPKTRQAALDALEATGLPERTRQLIQDSTHTIQDPKTRQAAFDAVEATGLPDKTRQLLQDSTRVLQDTQARAGAAARERVTQLAKDSQQQARHLQKQVNRRLQKPKPKRFLFA